MRVDLVASTLARTYSAGDYYNVDDDAEDLWVWDTSALNYSWTSSGAEFANTTPLLSLFLINPPLSRNAALNLAALLHGAKINGVFAYIK